MKKSTCFSITGMMIICSFTLLAQNPTVTDGVAIYHSNKNIGRKFLVPDSWDKIVIKENVTITGSFFMPDRTHPIEIAGESRETSIIIGDGSRPEDDGIKGRSYSAIRCNQSPDVYIHDLRSLDPMKFHISAGFGNVIVERCDLIDRTGTHTTDGVHGGRMKTVVKDCYIDTHDDALYLSECKLVENTTIVHNHNGAPFQVSWGATNFNGHTAVIRNCTVINARVGGNGRYLRGVVDWSSRNDADEANPPHVMLNIEFQGTFTRLTRQGATEAIMYKLGRNNNNQLPNVTVNVTGYCEDQNSTAIFGNGELNIDNTNCNGGGLQSRYVSQTSNIPGTIEVEYYDEGGQGVAYNDDNTRNGNGFRAVDNVDIANLGSGNKIGWNEDGEWLEYTLDVTAGDYDIIVTASSNNSTNEVGDLEVSLDGQTIGTVDIGGTGGWSAMQDFTVNNVSITGGNDKVLRLTVVGSGFDIDKIEFAAAACPDSDNDGVCNVDDGCPSDPDKTVPGNCGCGQPEVAGCGGSPTNIADLTATATACDQVQLSWSDVSGETAYRVRRKLSGASTFTNLTDVSANTTSYTDNAAAENTDYIYQVRPVVNATAVALSNEPQVATPPCSSGGGGGIVLIDHNSSGQRLKANGSGGAVGVKAASNTGVNVQWDQEDAGGGYFYLVHLGSGNKLSSSDGTVVNTVAPSNTDSNVQWQWIDAGGGWYRLENRAHTKWLHVRPDGTQFELGPTTWTGSNTQWQSTSVSGARFASEAVLPIADERSTDQVTIQVYPNPVSNALYLSGVKTGQIITIFDNTGKLIRKKIATHRMDVSALKPGLYFLKVDDQPSSRFIKR